MPRNIGNILDSGWTPVYGVRHIDRIADKIIVNPYRILLTVPWAIYQSISITAPFATTFAVASYYLM